MKLNAKNVSYHAIRRFRERTGSKRPDWHIRKTIAEVVENGDEIFPLVQIRLKPAKYFLWGGVVAVVADGKVVTTYIKDRNSKLFPTPNKSKFCFTCEMNTRHRQGECTKCRHREELKELTNEVRYA